jgi:RIO kinase 2
MVSTSHENAQFYFARDVKCIQVYFSKHYGLVFDGIPQLESDITREIDLDEEVRASGFIKEQLGDNAESVFIEVSRQQMEIKNNDFEEVDNEEEQKSGDEEEEEKK